MTTITLKINQNAGFLSGKPIAPNGWVATGAEGTTDTRYYVNPADGSYVRLTETDPTTGVSPLHAAPDGYRSASFWATVVTLSETPYNSNQVVLAHIVDDTPVPISSKPFDGKGGHGTILG